MGWLDVFRSEKKGSAQLAKERLQVVVAHRRSGQGDHPAYFPQLQQDLLAVLRKYVDVGDESVQMEIEREGDLEVLELNITLPEVRREQHQSKAKTKSKSKGQGRRSSLS